jgi:fatty-acyl-CoA synthase
MAALVVGPAFSLEALHRHMSAALPEFARPLFVRILPVMDMTSTFKQRKQDLARDGFDSGATPDALWFADPQSRSFVPIDAALYARIAAGNMRL